ncbi:hypothetical protein UFOVP435_40 [uncultured Caudovirales phage]|uniref:Uncharacterized protein n=1 Tax=uncultured Caudovirales phage TaxID=2100421 RepID=A0A6J5MB64_9CAUD|nr:hypothetical protein UFOVP435_40 [uncultured Caudovirales phage]
MAVDEEKRMENLLPPLQATAEVSQMDEQALDQSMSALTEGTPELVENEDGSVTIQDPAEGGDQSTAEFLENLAETVNQQWLRAKCSDLVELIKRDRESRQKHDELYAEGMKKTGVAGPAPGGAAFSGASNVTHPLLIEACVDFAASAAKELLPPSGPVKTRIHGPASKVKRERADRLSSFMNWQLTEQCPEFMLDSEQLLPQVGLAGTQYMKVLPNMKLNRPEFEFVPVDDMIIPYEASGYATASRRTHMQRPTKDMVMSRIQSGMYRDLTIVSPGPEPEETKVGEVVKKVEGRTPTGYNDEESRVVYEVDLFLDLEGNDPLAPDGETLPYILVIDELMLDAWALYRNWDEKDQRKVRQDWAVEYDFIPWRGAYALGFVHLIGGLSSAATGALRALLDSAHIQNSASGVTLKGTKINGQTQSPSPTEIVEIEGPPGVVDIRALMMPFPYAGPSPTLFQLLGFLTEAGKGVVSTAEEKISQASNQMPVGTALALIEQGAKVFSAIHGRLHRSQAQLFRIQCRVNKMLYSDPAALKELTMLGAPDIEPADFDQVGSISPASDPLIFSETQRLAQAQALKALAGGNPLYDQYAVERRVLESLKIPDVDQVLPKPKVPTELNAPAENLSAMMGQPIIAFPEQNHMAHIETHLRFILDPFLGGNWYASKTLLPIMMEHLKQHLGFLYVTISYDLATETLGEDVGRVLADKETHPKVDEVLAAGAKLVHAEMANKLQDIAVVLEQLMQSYQQMLPQPPKDPAVMAAEVASQESQRRAEADKAREQRESNKDAIEAVLQQAEMAQRAEESEDQTALGFTKLLTDLAVRLKDLEDKRDAQAAIQEGLNESKEDEDKKD